MHVQNEGGGSPTPSEASSKVEPSEHLDIDENSTLSSISTKGPTDFSELPSAIEIHPQNASLGGTNNQQFIKRPLNAYMIWTVEQRHKVQREPRQKMNEVSKAMGEVWKKMTAEEKAPYFESARKHADEHKKALKDNPHLAYVPSKKKMKPNAKADESHSSMPSSPDMSDIPESPAPTTLSYAPASSPLRKIPNAFGAPMRTYGGSATTITSFNSEESMSKMVPNMNGSNIQYVEQSQMPYSPLPPGYSYQQTIPHSQPQPVAPAVNNPDPNAASLNPTQMLDRYYSSLVQFQYPSPYEGAPKLRDPNYYYDMFQQATRYQQ